MKRTLRLLATLLSIALLICALPQSVLAQIGELLSEETTTQTETASPEVYVLGEVIENRTETSKTFRMSDGSFIAADYGKTVHYADENGAWTDYDNTWQFADATADEDLAGYENKAADVRIKLANNSNSNNLLKLTFGDYKVSMHLVGADKSKALERYPAMEKPEGNDIDAASTLHKFSAGAIYKDILPDVDLEYIIAGGKVKENIIIKDTSDSYTYTFELKLHGLVPEMDANGNVLLRDETNKTQLVIPAGYMYDADGAYSDAVTYSIAHKNGKKYTLTVTADADWINADERAFPVTLDPTFEAFDSTTNTLDTYISQNSPDTATDHTLQQMVAGYYNNSTAKEWHVLIQSQVLPSIPASAVVVDAKMRIAHLNIYHTSVNLVAKQITSDWNSANVTWNTKPTYGSEILDYASVNSSTVGQYIEFDVTKLAQKWYDGTATNYGIAVCPIAGNGTGHAYLGTSDNPSDKPHLLVSYRDTKGLEGIWTYSSHGVGSAGAGYVNGFNGNLVFVHGDMTTQGSILPVAVSHVYNSAMAEKQFDSSMPVGRGWKLSVQETLTPYEIDGNPWYRYNDADGTDLYFYPDQVPNPTKYLSEDGYGLTVTKSGSMLEMTDDYGNKKVFDTAGKLVRIEDVYGNQKLFTYNSNKLEYIKYIPAGESTPIEQLEFAYNNAGALTKIINKYNPAEYISFLYSSSASETATDIFSGYLREIIYNNTNEFATLAEYTYNTDGTLQTAKDGDTGYTVTYAYQNNRVASVTESVDGTNGQTVGFTYANKQFTVRTSGNDDVYGNTDDLFTTAVFDHFGKTVCAYSHDASGKTVYGTSYAEYTTFEQGAKTNNKLKAESVKGITNENLVTNSNAESITNWSNNSSGTGYSAAYSTAESYLGNGSLKLQSTNGGGGAAWLSQNVTVSEAGTYTLSAYVKITSASSNTNGLTLMLDYQDSETLTDANNENINNGWRRISVTKTLSAGTHTIDIDWSGTVGTAYIDCIQLEKSDTPSAFNMLADGSLRTLDDWSGTYAITTTDATHAHVGVLNGAPTGTRSAYQTVTVGAPLSTTFMLTGWARANSVDIVPEDGITTDTAKANRKFGMRATLTYSNNTTEEHYVSFNPDVTVWQYASLAIVPQKTDASLTVKSIKVAVVYDYNANTMYFDDICLTVEPAQTYAYDENGNLKSTTDIEGNDSLMEYAENNIDLENFTTVTGDRYTYEYYETHDIKSAERTVDGVTQKLEYTYDDYGNPKKTTLTATGTSETFTSSATYSEYGNYLQSVTDSLGKVTTYDYDATTKLLNFVQDANGNKTAYKYDGRNRTTNVYLDADGDGVIDTNEASVLYLYANNRLSGIETATTEYTLTYDTFGNVKTIKAGNNTLATYNYAANNGKLLKLTYGNGDFEEYSYDLLDRLAKVVYNGNANSGYELQYDANGRLFQTIDREVGITHTYEYDSLGRLIRAWQKNTSNGSVILGVENAYDEYGRASGSKYLIGSTAQNYGITYEDITGLVHTYTTPQNSFTYSYDNFDRLTRKLGSVHLIAYTYVAGTQRVQTYTISQADASSITYTYTYDNLGNITSVKKNGTTVSNYEYDKLGRLIRESDCANSTAWVYTYDNAGNLLKKYTFYGVADTAPAAHLLGLHPYNGSEISATYTYSSSAWGDLLTNYNGTVISYDQIGNPLKWRNATSLTWDKRSLQSMTLSSGTAVSFEYNASGIRTQKTVGTTVHDYILDGSTILKETVTSSSGTTTLYYYYDESGISGVSYNGTKYSFVRNLQGDVIGIINGNGVTVVEYKYDAWGNILSVTGSLASTLGTVNPFRYRGYYYDTETGFYYLNSRYYDPQVGRFINADSYVSTGQGLTGYNMFAYCNNNPVMYVDPYGMVPGVLESTVVLGVMLLIFVADIPNSILVADLSEAITSIDISYSSDISPTFPQLIDTKIDSHPDIYYDTHQDELDTNPDVPEEEEEEEAVDVTLPIGTHGKDGRLHGTEGDINIEGYKETHIGEDGSADWEKHNTDHGNPKYHNNPHWHRITWTPDGKPIFSEPINIF